VTRSECGSAAEDDPRKGGRLRPIRNVARNVANLDPGTSDVLRAAVVAALVSPAPSTLHALLSDRDPFGASVAAGSILLREEKRRTLLVAAAVPVHVALSLGWTVVLTRILPRKRPITEGALAGLVIAGLDLGLLGRRYERVRALSVLPQVADHVAFGIVVEMVLTRRSAWRRRSGGGTPVEAEMHKVNVPPPSGACVTLWGRRLLSGL
jgi:hypothetical protein